MHNFLTGVSGINVNIFYKYLCLHAYCWRTNNGAEVDFVIKHQDKLIPIEVKGGVQIKKQSLRGMNSFIESQTNKRVPFGIVLYRGDNVIYLDRNIIGVPLTSVF